jgi:hypothetical protein
MDKFCKEIKVVEHKNVCKYCKKQFKRSDYLHTHLKNRCFVKKHEENEKNTVYKQLMIQIKKQSDEIKWLKRLVLLKNGGVHDESYDKSHDKSAQNLFILINGIPGGIPNGTSYDNNFSKKDRFICHKN